jgi:hypothetical protein
MRDWLTAAFDFVCLLAFLASMGLLIIGVGA